jgi:hypothetical protein
MAISDGSQLSAVVVNYTFPELPSDAYINHIYTRIRGNSTATNGVLKIQYKPAASFAACTVASGYQALPNQFITLTTLLNAYISGDIESHPPVNLPYILRGDLYNGNNCFSFTANTTSPAGLPIGMDGVQMKVNYSTYIQPISPTPIPGPSIIPSPTPIPGCGVFDIKCNIWNAFVEFFNGIFGFNLLFQGSTYQQFADLFNSKAPFGYITIFTHLDWSPVIGASTDWPSFSIPINYYVNGTQIHFTDFVFNGNYVQGKLGIIASVFRGYFSVIILLGLLILLIDSFLYMQL